jgi:Family of unknown function (DUF6166)
MKIYQGKRTIDGLVVTVDGRPLGEHYEVKRFTKFGFEWTYEGDSPRRLALAILADYLGDIAKAIRLCEPFMKQVVAISTTIGSSPAPRLMPRFAILKKADAVR